MSTHPSSGPVISRVAAAAIAQFLLLTIDSNDKFALCGVADKPIAQSSKDTSSGAVAPGRLPADGVWELQIAAAVSFRDRLYTAANGQVTSTYADDCTFVGIALMAGTTQNDVIAVLPAPMIGQLVQDLSALTYALTYAAPNAGAINSGDAGTDTVIASLRTQLIALAADSAATAADVAAIRADLVASQLFKT